ncbi:hypothetical protein E2C01_023035 [Portunus trituberculatus]|uniref:Nuclease HARBI1 n=1 Tax=Portunus trituberculatus TaxID=210409 RepID=A0A5B7E8V7_PORTR|nr:hypothetical protein [Portunus trituberculatus]
MGQGIQHRAGSENCILVCALLHNICKDRNIPEPDAEGDIGEGIDGDPDPPAPQPPVGARPLEGLLYRDEYVNLYFHSWLATSSSTKRVDVLTAAGGAAVLGVGSAVVQFKHLNIPQFPSPLTISFSISLVSASTSMMPCSRADTSGT